MSRSVRIFIACAVGALIGTLIGLSHPGILWRIGGVLLGATCGYLFVDFGQIVHEVPYAWSKASSVYKKAPDHSIEMVFCGGISMVFGLVMLFLTSFVVIGHPVISVFNLQMDMHVLMDTVYVIVMMTSLIAGCVGLAFAASILTPPYQALSKEVYYFKKVYLFLNPLMLPITLIVSVVLGPVYGLYKLVANYRWVAKQFFKAGKVVAKFLWFLFTQIHSDIRVLCLVDAGIGTVLGIFYFGSPVMGAFAGGLLGLLNYEIVTKRILHLVPVTRRD